MDQPNHHSPLRNNQPGAADRMRELLARTVQDHVADQQSNADALEDIRQRMEGLEWLVNEVRERQLAGLTVRLDGLTQHLTEAAGRFGRLEAAVTELSQQTARLEQRLAGTDGKLGALDARLERLDERLDDQYDRVSAIDHTLAAADTKLGQLAEELRSRPGLAEINNAVAAIVDAAQQDVAAHLGSLEETIFTLAEALLRPPIRPAVRAAGRPAVRAVPTHREGTRG